MLHGNDFLGAPQGREPLVNQAVPDEGARLVHVVRHQDVGLLRGAFAFGAL